MSDSILEVNNADDEDSGAIIDVQIESLAPAPPGWFACYTEDDNPRSLVLYPIAAFAIVEITQADESTYKVVRPFAAAPDGELEDVIDFPNFLCVAGPGQDPRVVASEAREAAGEEEEPSRIIT